VFSPKPNNLTKYCIDFEIFKKHTQRYLAYRLLNDLLELKFPKVTKPKKAEGLVPLNEIFDVYNGLASSQVVVSDDCENDSDIRYIRPCL
jgi:hypothetical protein